MGKMRHSIKFYLDRRKIEKRKKDGRIKPKRRKGQGSTVQYKRRQCTMKKAHSREKKNKKGDLREQICKERQQPEEEKAAAALELFVKTKRQKYNLAPERKGA